jgi:hypothetical protein
MSGGTVVVGGVVREKSRSDAVSSGAAADDDAMSPLACMPSLLYQVTRDFEAKTGESFRRRGDKE